MEDSDKKRYNLWWSIHTHVDWRCDICRINGSTDIDTGISNGGSMSEPITISCPGCGRAISLSLTKVS